MNNKLVMVSIFALVAAFGMSAIAIGLENNQVSVLQAVGQKNQAGGNTQKGLVNSHVNTLILYFCKLIILILPTCFLL